jgi:hypothetical protein
MTTAVTPALLIYLVVGAAFGALLARIHLGALRRAVDLQVGSRQFTSVMLLHVGRIAVTVGALALVAWIGKASMLLALLAGFELSRRHVLRATAPQ